MPPLHIYSQKDSEFLTPVTVPTIRWIASQSKIHLSGQQAKRNQTFMFNLRAHCSILNSVYLSLK